MDASNTILAARRARWAVAAVFGINGFMIGSWAPQILLVQTRLGITESTLGLLILCFGIGALVSMPWCGWLMARFGQRAVLRFFGVAQVIGLALVVLSPNVPVTGLAMVVFGATLGCCDVAMNAATVTVERTLSRAVMSSMHGFWSLGGFAGAAIGGRVLEAFGALTHSLLVGAVALVAALATLPYILEARDAPVPANGVKRRVGLPRSLTIYLLGLIAMFCFVAEGAVLDWGAIFLRKELGAELAVTGLGYAFFSGMMATMRFLGDRVRDRFGAVRTMRASSLLAAVAMLSAAFAPNAPLTILAFAVCGIGVANAVPIAFSAAGNQPGLSAGAGMSVATTMGYAGILLAPASIGFVGEHLGFRPVFAAMALLLFTVFLMSGLVRAADAKEDAKPPRLAV